MTRRRFLHVDVFGAERFLGNPLAVIVDSEDLATAEMELITRWMNLSECAFLLPPTDPAADYRVRIFTLRGELPFAGHPTLGSCHAWIESGGKPRQPGAIAQECGAGLIALHSRDDGFAFRAPELVRSGPADPAFVGQLATVLGIEIDDVVDSHWVDNGPGWVAVLLADAAAVLSLEPDFRRYTGPGGLDIGVVGPHLDRPDLAYEVRAFFSDGHGGMVEDPVTGSLNASVAQWMLATGRVTAPYVAAQGTALGRKGLIGIDQDSSGVVWVGGSTTTITRGEIET
ncbi:MAG: PhzF family phenazine biosynthesis protein [Acidimicrobiia bacterium]